MLTFILHLPHNELLMSKSAKNSRRVYVFLATALFVVFAVSVAVKAYLTINELADTKTKLSYSLKADKSEVQRGDKVSVSLFLEGHESASTIAFDVKIGFDKKKLKLVKATPGDFFAKYLTVKWDEETSWFALAQAPNSQSPIDPDRPLVTLEFTALEGSPETEIKTLESTVYISKVGGFKPQSGGVVLKLQ